MRVGVLIIGGVGIFLNVINGEWILITLKSKNRFKGCPSVPKKNLETSSRRAGSGAVKTLELGGCVQF